MIELAMVFALGFLAACLLALLALPLVSRRARRDERRELERRLPLSLAEVAAERDQLRAAHAVAVRQAEQRAEAFEPRLAAAMAEAGRHSAALRVAEEERGARETASAALRSSLSDVAGRAEAAEAIVATQGRQLESLAATEAAARHAVARLAGTVADTEAWAREAEATAATQTIALNDLAAQAERDAGRLADATARLAATPAPGDERPAASAGLEDQRALPQGRAAARPLAEEGVPLHAALSRLRKEQSMMMKTVAAATGERDRLRLRVDELLLRLEDLQAEADARDDGALADRPGSRASRTIAALTSRLATREAELAAARAAAQNKAPRDAAALRLAIADLAAELVRHATEPPDTDTP